MIAIGFAFGIMSFDPGEPPAGGNNETAALGGCVLNNDAFKDPGTFKTPEDIISKITNKSYTSKLNSDDQKRRLQDLIDQTAVGELVKDDATVAKVNPALLVAIWAGEQTFGDPDKALGYGVCTGCGTKFHTWDKQVKGAIKAINDAMNNRGYYTQPKGESIFTRLFFNYTGAMKTEYNSKGYVADEKNARIAVLKDLVPDSVTCTSKLDAMDVPYLNQCNSNGAKPDWSKQNPKGSLKSGSICGSGCHLTSMAMINNFLKGENLNPYQLGMKFDTPNAFSVKGSLDATGLKLDSFEKSGYDDFPIEEIKAKLAKREPILWRMANYTGDPAASHTRGHFNVIIGVASNGDIIANDPSVKAGYLYKKDPKLYGLIPGHKVKFYFYAFKK